MRSKSASELWTSTCTPSRLPIGKNSRVCSVVNATSVPMEIAVEPCAASIPPAQYTSAGITANVVWMDAIIQRPVIRLFTSSEASRSDSLSNRPASSAERPIVLPRRIPETESDSCTSEEMSAIDSCRTAVTFRR